MTETYYKKQLSKIYKENFKHCDIKKLEPILAEFVELARQANDNQNNRNSYSSYQKTEKGKNAQRRQYEKRTNKIISTKDKEDKNKLLCLACKVEIRSKFEVYNIAGERPYCEKCYDKWVDNIIPE